jgi:hypothetical protein
VSAAPAEAIRIRVRLFAVQREPYTFGGWHVGLHQGLKLFGTEPNMV